MRCLKCNNTKDFIVFGNQNLRVKFNKEGLKKIKKENFSITDIYPVICGKCESEEVDFNYREIEKIKRKIKFKRS